MAECSQHDSTDSLQNTLWSLDSVAIGIRSMAQYTADSSARLCKVLLTACCSLCSKDYLLRANSQADSLILAQSQSLEQMSSCMLVRCRSCTLKKAARPSSW